MLGADKPHLRDVARAPEHGPAHLPQRLLQGQAVQARRTARRAATRISSYAASQPSPGTRATATGRSARSPAPGRSSAAGSCRSSTRKPWNSEPVDLSSTRPRQPGQDVLAAVVRVTTAVRVSAAGADEGVVVRAAVDRRAVPAVLLDHHRAPRSPARRRRRSAGRARGRTPRSSRRRAPWRTRRRCSSGCPSAGLSDWSPSTCASLEVAAQRRRHVEVADLVPRRVAHHPHHRVSALP